MSSLKTFVCLVVCFVSNFFKQSKMFLTEINPVKCFFRFDLLPNTSIRVYVRVSHVYC